MELRQFFAVILRRLWLIILAIALVGGMTYYLSISMTPIYSASATLQIDYGADPRTDPYTSIVTSERSAKTYVEMMKSPTLLGEVIAALALPFTATQLQSAINVQQLRDTQLIQVSVEDSDPVRAKAKFECKPPHSFEAFFRDEAKVLKAFQAQRDEGGELTPLPSARPSPVSTSGAILEWFGGQPGTNYYIHIDLGLTRDRAGLAMAHHAGWQTVETGGTTHDVPRICLDLVTGFEPPPGGEVDFSQVRQMILNLKDRGFRSVYVTYDGWQSADSIQILNKAGIEADILSVDRNTAAYDTLQELIYGGRLDGYFHPLLIEELLQLSIVHGRKVDHPAGGSKDLADAVAGAVFGAAQDEPLGGGWLF